MFEPDWWNDFKEWETEFKKSDPGIFALSKMKKKLGKGESFKYYGILEDQVLKNCFFAKTYKKKNDRSDLLRNRYGLEFKKELNKQIKKINELRDFIKKYPEIPEYGFQYNENLKEKDLFFYSRKNNTPPYYVNFDKLLEIYSEILHSPKLPMLSGPGGYRFNIGGICYPYQLPLDAQTQRGKISTILAFRLVELFRQHTNPKCSWRKALINFHRGMPEFGEPCYELAGNFVNAIFNKDLTAGDIKKSVDKLSDKKVVIHPWPQQASSFEHCYKVLLEEKLIKPIINKGGVLMPNKIL